MTWKTNVLIGATVLGMATGVNDLLSVKTPEDVKHYQQNQTVEQGADAVDDQNARQRDKLPGGIDADDHDRLRPGELRPAEKPLKLRFRP